MGRKQAITKIAMGVVLTGFSARAMQIDLVFGWVALIFFGWITLLLLIRYFKTVHESRGAKPGGKKRVTDLANDTGTANNEGIFSYNEKGFTVKIEEKVQTIQWKQVRSMIAYKLDRFASEDICLDVFCDGNITFTISEETNGWSVFLDNSKKALIVIDKFWEIEMAAPGPNLTLSVIYDRQNRSLKDIQKEYYSN